MSKKMHTRVTEAQAERRAVSSHARTMAAMKRQAAEAEAVKAAKQAAMAEMMARFASFPSED